MKLEYKIKELGKFLDIKRDISSLSLAAGIYIASYGYIRDLDNITAMGIGLITIGIINKCFYYIKN